MERRMRIISAVKRVEVVSDRMSYIILADDKIGDVTQAYLMYWSSDCG
jgi:hypothetical protein